MLYRFLLTVFGYKYNKSFIHNSLRMNFFVGLQWGVVFLT